VSLTLLYTPCLIRYAPPCTHTSHTIWCSFKFTHTHTHTHARTHTTARQTTVYRFWQYCTLYRGALQTDDFFLCFKREMSSETAETTVCSIDSCDPYILLSIYVMPLASRTSIVRRRGLQHEYPIILAMAIKKHSRIANTSWNGTVLVSLNAETYGKVVHDNYWSTSALHHEIRKYSSNSSFLELKSGW